MTWKAVIKAVLLDDDVSNAISCNISQTGPTTWTVNVTDNGTEDSRLGEPMTRYTSFLRKFNATPDYPTGRYMMADMGYHWRQKFMGSPSVFNFYLPDHQPAGDIVNHEGSPQLPMELYTRQNSRTKRPRIARQIVIAMRSTLENRSTG